MSKPAKSSYDAVIIGAGMSGLVCGCYLARGGLKVLILEQHDKPGGYCTSFSRMGFTFDAAAHSFGGYRKEGIVRKVFDDLEIGKKVSITQYEPSDVVVTPDCKVAFWPDVDKTIRDFQQAFPDESSSIRDFFIFLIDPDHRFFAQTRSWSFKNLLDKYFHNEKLKGILAFPLFGNGALPPSLMSALIGAKIFREFLLDGGYYPEGGMQTLPDALAQRFAEFGGDLRLSCRVNRIHVEDRKITGVSAEKFGFIASKYVISGCDARQTFLELLGKEKVENNDFLNDLQQMIPSASIFVLYLGLSTSFRELSRPGTNIWMLSHYDLDSTYRSLNELNLEKACTMVRVTPDQKTILAFVNAPFRDKHYWDSNKEKLMLSFIDRIEQYIPGLSKHIAYKTAATPNTLHRYTLNYEGAAYGWACTTNQLGIPDLRKPSFIQGLYLTGHWTTQGLGIPGVVYTGQDTARYILKKERNDMHNFVIR